MSPKPPSPESMGRMNTKNKKARMMRNITFLLPPASFIREDWGICGGLAPLLLVDGLVVGRAWVSRFSVFLRRGASAFFRPSGPGESVRLRRRTVFLLSSSLWAKKTGA